MSIRTRSMLVCWTGPMLVAAVGAAMWIWTRDTWPDPVTDFGKEIYLAWQLSAGRHLYQDVAYHLGPLSPYLNALAFKIFGPSLATIEYFNLFLLTLMIVLIYRLIARIAGALAATAACLTFVTLFAFAHFTQITDYNYICPYDHAHTHGILIGLLSLTAAAHYLRTRAPWAIFTTGLTIGLAFLTRAELFVAAAAGVGTLLYLGTRQKNWPIKSLSSLFTVGLLCPILIGWALLSAILPAHLAFRGLLGSWPIVLDHTVAANPFYRDSMGTLDFSLSLGRLLRWTIWWSLLLLPAIAAGRRKQKQTVWIVCAFLWAAIGAYLIGHWQDPADAFAPLPLALIACMYLARRRGPLALGAMVWALALLGKILLNARISHYGFVLAMPATLLVVAVGVSWTTPPVRAAVLGALLVTASAYLGLANRLMATQVYDVGTGRNYFRADDRGGMLNDCLLALRQNATPGQTLAVMPEGAMLNFLSGLPNPTPYWSYNPPYAFFAPGQGEAAGQEKILHALQAHPPDWIAVVAEDLSDFGTPFFGRDYGVQIYSFIQAGYTPAAPPFGPDPYTPVGPARPLHQFGVMLLRRVRYNEHHAVPTGR